MGYLTPMNQSDHLPRSPLMMSRDDSALLVVDAQTKLLDVISNSDTIIWNIRRLLDGAKILGVPAAATEQYPEKLGHIADILADRIGETSTKLRFSCGGCPQVFQKFADDDKRRILVVGIETHVCIMQTVLDLLTEQFDVHVAVDAVTARNTIDHDTALQRMQLSGAVLTTTETALFEWCEVSGTPEFKEISKLIREKPQTGKRLGF